MRLEKSYRETTEYFIFEYDDWDEYNVHGKLMIMHDWKIKETKKKENPYYVTVTYMRKIN